MPTVKPRLPILNFRNPLTKGLVFDIPLFEGGGTVARELVKRLNGAITAATWSNHKSGKCLTFSGTTDKIDIPYTTENSLITLEISVLRNGDGGNLLGRMINKTNSITFFSNNSGGQNSYAFSQQFSSGTEQWEFTRPSTGVWKHIVIVYNSGNTSNTPSIYMDGVLQSLSNTVHTGSGSAASNTNDYFIGNNSTSIRNWDGKIAYVRLWNRLLSPSEARKLYQDPWCIYRKSLVQRLQKGLNAFVNIGS